MGALEMYFNNTKFCFVRYAVNIEIEISIEMHVPIFIDFGKLQTKN